jgi:hypothetical protein
MELRPPEVARRIVEPALPAPQLPQPLQR